MQLFVFIVDIQKNGDKIGKIVSSFLGRHVCSSTGVGVTDLIMDAKLILEITAVAYI